MAKTPDSYHHGELRTALIEEAATMISSGGTASLTMRAIGERLGVSRSASYRHFADKDALLVAVAAAGYERLKARLQSVGAGTRRSGVDRLRRIGEEYIRFALENPAHYRLMYGREALTREDQPELRKTANIVFEQVIEAIKSHQKHGELKRQNARVQAYVAWSALHGLASLLIEGQIVSPIDVNTLIRQTTRTVLDGMRVQR